MARLPDQRPGEILTVKQRPIPFSFQSVVQGSRRFGLQSRIFATNPWGIIRRSIEADLSSPGLDHAIALVAQAEDFYRSAATSHITNAKPLLIYYSFLNLAKALVLKTKTRADYSRAMHGLKEAVTPFGREFFDSYLEAHSRSRAENVFDDLQMALYGNSIASQATTRFDLPALWPQLLHGHRIWCDAARAPRERFVEITEIEYMHDKPTKSIWLTLNIFSDDLTRFEITRKKLLEESGIGTTFKEVKPSSLPSGRRLLKFEQVSPLMYSGRPSDELASLATLIRPRVWTSVLAVAPFRKYYLYLCPANEKQNLMEQLLSIYSVFYYLGSITRYRPHLFEQVILRGEYGAFIEEIVSNTPQQFLYLIASEFAEREVSLSASI